ncbi:hypothetical protein OF83DRAFT_1174078 [Amylostereum chailletii]|nr:hypothetical protein OF83DRAFT_1174078 [Amylostereum chailletii]
MHPDPDLVTDRRRMPHVALDTLPYDLLLHIIHSLDLPDACSLQRTCKALHYIVQTRPVRRHLAAAVLLRCRPLTLRGFQRLSDLSNDQIYLHIKKATLLERSWLRRTPRPTPSFLALDPPPPPHCSSSPTKPNRRWYKVISTPPREKLEWLSPITAIYSLCATQSGRLICWDVCRVEFDQKMVYFVMAKVLSAAKGDIIRTEFRVMKVCFAGADDPPTFTVVKTFVITGSILNIFLLDPVSRLLAAYVWISATQSIALYVLLDWDKDESVFIDTGLKCVPFANWSCVLADHVLVMHCESDTHAYQYHYPLPVLTKHRHPTFLVLPTCFLKPTYTTARAFRFPVLPPTSYRPAFRTNYIGITSNGAHEIVLRPPPRPAFPFQDGRPPPNPFPSPWHPEGAHFVRQWWPTLTDVPRLSCTAVLYALHDYLARRSKYVLSQHYFSVPLRPSSPLRDLVLDPLSEANQPIATDEHDDDDNDDDMLMRKWFVSTPFEIVTVNVADVDDPAGVARERPLLAVDFGHAVWIEHADGTDDGPSEGRRLRFVSFPSVRVLPDGSAVRSGVERHRDTGGSEDGEGGGGEEAYEMEGRVRTLEIPLELDLHLVESVNLDQSQGAVLLSVSEPEGKVFILYYE